MTHTRRYMRIVKRYDSLPRNVCAACILICCEVGSEDTAIRPPKARFAKVWATLDYEKTKYCSTCSFRRCMIPK